MHDYIALFANRKLQINIEWIDNVKVFDSSKWAERGFCGSCGTYIFYRIKGTGKYSVPAGFFPDLQDLKIEVQYFIERKPSYYCFSNKTNGLTEK